MQSGQEGQPLEMLGMAEESLLAYAETLVEEGARLAAEARGASLEEELETPSVINTRLTLQYVVKLLVANNAYFTNHLLELGVLRTGDGVILQNEER